MVAKSEGTLGSDNQHVLMDASQPIAEEIEIDIHFDDEDKNFRIVGDVVVINNAPRILERVIVDSLIKDE